MPTPTTPTLLARVKNALRLTVNGYDDELTVLIASALADMGLTAIDSDILVDTTTDALIIRAVITYCRLHFGAPSDYDRLKASYDEQKSQLITATGYGFPEPEDSE